MAKAALLDHVPIPPGQVFPLVGDPTPALRRVPPDAAGRPRFDVIHLGLGDDGHTASLFPGSPALQEAHALVAVVHDAPKPPPERLTFTLPVINAARAVLFMVQGASKREKRWSRVWRRDPAAPASLVQPVDGEPEVHRRPRRHASRDNHLPPAGGRVGWGRSYPGLTPRLSLHLSLDTPNPE